VGELSWAVEQLPHNSARTKKLTESTSEFIVRDLRPVSIVDGVMVFLVPCRRTMDTVMEKMHCKTKPSVFQEMDSVSYHCMMTDMLIWRWLYLNDYPLH